MVSTSATVVFQGHPWIPCWLVTVETQFPNPRVTVVL
jgi:hypothetical protein